MKQLTHKQQKMYSNNKNATEEPNFLGTVSRTTTGVGAARRGELGWEVEDGGRGGEWWRRGLNPILLDRSRTHKTDATPNYKHMYCLHKVLHLISETSR